MREVTRFEVFSVQFDVDAAVVAYMVVPDDVRVDGMVGIQRQMRLDMRHPDYADDVEKLRSRVQRMLANAMEDFENSQPWQPDADDDDDDDERGMGDG